MVCAYAASSAAGFDAGGGAGHKCGGRGRRLARQRGHPVGIVHARGGGQAFHLYLALRLQGHGQGLQFLMPGALCPLEGLEGVHVVGLQLDQVQGPPHHLGVQVQKLPQPLAVFDVRHPRNLSLDACFHPARLFPLRTSARPCPYTGRIRAQVYDR